MANSVELRVECLKNNISLDTLAARIGVNTSTLYRKIKGESEFNRNELQIIKVLYPLMMKGLLLFFLTNNLQKCKSNANKQQKILPRGRREEGTA